MRGWTHLDGPSELNDLLQRLLIRRPAEVANRIGVAGFGELCPVKAHELTKLGLVGAAFPIIWE